MYLNSNLLLVEQLGWNVIMPDGISKIVCVCACVCVCMRALLGAPASFQHSMDSRSILHNLPY